MRNAGGFNELFAKAVLRMMAKDPAERFQSPKQLLQELKRIGTYDNLHFDWSDA